MVLCNLAHAVLVKVQSAFFVEEVRSVKQRFQVKSPFCVFLLEYFYCVGQICKWFCFFVMLMYSCRSNCCARLYFSSNPLLLISLVRMHSGLFEALRMEPVISCLFLKYYCIVSSMFWSVNLTNISFCVSWLPFMCGTLLFQCRIVIMRIGVPPPNFYRVVCFATFVFSLF